MEGQMEDKSQWSEFEQAKAIAREVYGKMPLHELVEQMQQLRKTKDNAEAELSLINAYYDVIRMESIPNKMDEDGIDNVTFDGIGRVGLTSDMFVSVTDKPGLYDWLQDNGFGDLIQPVVNSSTLKAFIKNRIKAGKDVPEEFVKYTPFTRASITAKK